MPRLAYATLKSKGSLATAAILALAGVVLCGQGLWIHAKAIVAQVLLERAFAQTLATGQDAKPWPWADTWPVARIEVPRLGKSAIVLHGSSGQALAFGPGQLERTPPAGEPGTSARLWQTGPVRLLAALVVALALAPAGHANGSSANLGPGCSGPRRSSARGLTGPWAS